VIVHHTMPSPLGPAPFTSLAGGSESLPCHRSVIIWRVIAEYFETRFPTARG
jgi:hypothetical protein